MDKVTTEVKHVDLNGQHVLAIFDLINANEDQFEISLNSPYAEGGVSGNIVYVNAFVDIIGYDRRDPEQEIIIQREEEFELSIDDLESAEIQFDVVHGGALESEPLPTLTDIETMMLLGEDAKVVVRFEVK